MFSSRDSNPITLITRKGERVLFRSTLEARWSVYFDVMGFEWKYEPFRYDIGGGITYTPDFKVDDIGLIEIKPSPISLSPSLPRIEKFVRQTGERVYAFCSGLQPYVSIIAMKDNKFKVIELEWLTSEIVLGGKSRREAAINDTYLFKDAIQSAFKMANNAKIKGGEPKTPEERQIVAKWKKEPLLA